MFKLLDVGRMIGAGSFFPFDFTRGVHITLSVGSYLQIHYLFRKFQAFDRNGCKSRTWMRLSLTFVKVVS